VTGSPDLRAAITGLIGFAGTEEQMLLAARPFAEEGDPACWAAAPLVAHITDFKRQQVDRLRAIALGIAPAEFPDVDHCSAELYRGYAARSAGQVASESCQVTASLLDALRSVSEADLLEPSRHAWLKGRQLWLQVIVRGFWHPAGHLAEYYLRHAQPDRALALATQGVCMAGYVAAPDPARGMASYNLACAAAGAGQLEDAAAALAQAVELNPDVRVNARRDPDLAALRASGLLPEGLS
jgi:hypothetical protein